VLSAFGLSGADSEPLPGGSAYRCQDVVLKPVHHAAEAAWLAKIFEQLRVTDLRIARPIRATDGRWVVAGWSAQRFLAGRPEPRYHEIIEVSLVLHRATADIERPPFLSTRESLFNEADRLSSDDQSELSVLGDGHGAQLFGRLAAGRRPVGGVPQLVHGDLFGNVLFAGSAPPAVIDFTPYWHPASWAAAVVAVDALSWGGASTDLLTDWDDVPDWSQMLRRALLFRLAISLLHPRTTPSSLVEILSAVEVIEPFLD
jgi:uncharacterized protein (TIGR02569 family)